MSDMPDYIIRGENPLMLDDGVKYIRHDLYEALEAQKKMLAEALLDLIDGYVDELLYDEAAVKHAEAIAPAQRIGGRE